MWTEWDDLRPIAAVLNNLLSVFIYGDDLPNRFVDLLFFLCARGSRECSWRSMVKIFGARNEDRLGTITDFSSYSSEDLI